ncbi:hypothetical protein HanRHA438_Chr13g0594571 [Helianthus annuus]|nr:hypothetical protein HanRHA438_Chr13g0594571 [Helianthus annuus]
MSVVCVPNLQASAREDVAQMSAVCKEKRVCFFPSKTTSHTQALSFCSLSLSTNSLSLQPPPPPHHLRHHTTASLSLSLRSLSHRTHSLSLQPPPPPPHHLRHHHRTTSAITQVSHRSFSLYDLSLSLSTVSLN